MISITPPDYNDICQRWHQATVANNYLKWHAISSWLAAVSIMCNVDDMPEAGESVRVASDLAHAARAGHPAGAGNGGGMNPPVTYCMSLDDLTLMADAACELDGCKDLVPDEGSARRIKDMVTRMHDAVERAAGMACGMIYHEEDGRGS